MGKNITVTVRAGARKNSVEIFGEGYKVWTTEAPEKGKANEAVRELLAEYLKVGKSKLSLVRGASSKKKIFELAD